MTFENQPVNQAPASVVDIVSFGYKTAIKTLWPITRLSLPITLIHGILGGLQMSYTTDMVKHAPTLWMVLISLAYLLSVVFSVYNHYAVACYVNDIYLDRAGNKLFSYMLPKKNIFGVMGLSLLSVVAMIPAFIIILIGMILLVIPGLALMSYFSMAELLVFVVFMSNPELGVFASISESLRLLKGAFWRTILLGFTTWLTSVIITFPLSIFHTSISVLGKMVPTFTHSFAFPILCAVAFTVLIWFSLCVGYVGVLFTLYRYASDLRGRMATISELQHVEPAPSVRFGIK